MSNNAQKVWVVIPAAGIGTRMRSDIPKQYLKINDHTILEHTLACFASQVDNGVDVAGIIVALSREDDYWDQLKLAKRTADIYSTPLYTVEGGASRSESVMQALDYLTTLEQLSKDHWIMVHDAARPCLSQADLKQLFDTVTDDNSGIAGGILAYPVRDTMKRAKKNKTLIDHTESRDDLWHALTPQMFKLGELQQALIDCEDKQITVTDEASAMEAMGYEVTLVEGDSSNIKITRPADLALATWLLDQIQ